MSGLTQIAVSDAWPLTIIAALLILRPALLRAVDRMQEVRYGRMKASFHNRSAR